MVELDDLREEDADYACWLIADAMNEDEGLWAKKTMQFHFGCQRAGLDDGRSYYKFAPEEEILGLVGLHHYAWGPVENVWLAWFAVAPALQGQGLGRSLLEAVESRARDRGYLKLFIETYDQSDFESARRFYRARGYAEVGQVADYLPDSHSMIVFKKSLV